MLLTPGTYDLDVTVGYGMSVAGVGASPADVVVNSIYSADQVTSIYSARVITFDTTQRGWATAFYAGASSHSTPPNVGGRLRLHVSSSSTLVTALFAASTTRMLKKQKRVSVSTPRRTESPRRRPGQRRARRLDAELLALGRRADLD